MPNSEAGRRNSAWGWSRLRESTRPTLLSEHFLQCAGQQAGSVAAMDPDRLLDHLDRAERHIASYRKRVTEQIEFIAWLAWLRKDATGAKEIGRAHV